MDGWAFILLGENELQINELIQEISALLVSICEKKVHYMKGWDETLAKQAVADLIAGGTEFNVVYAQNDNMARGACDAMDAAGITYGKNGDVKVIAFDANKWALEMVLAGDFNLDVECNPLHGPRIVKLINQLEAGEDVPKDAYVEEEMFDSETITQAIVDARSY